MDLESLVLEALQRIKKLEQQVEELTDKLGFNDHLDSIEDERTSSAIKEKSITRSEARQKIMGALEQYNLGATTRRAKRDEGGGIVLTLHAEPETSYFIKFFYSKAYTKDGSTGWHAIAKEDLENEAYKFYIFSIYYNDSLHSLVFTKDELRSLTINKIKDQGNRYHFGFSIEGEKAYDTRDQRIDVTYALNKFELI